MLFASIYYFKGAYNQRLIAYNSPFVIIGALSVFLLFRKFHIKKNAVVNYIAVSSFAAFLFHGNHFFVDEVFVPRLKESFAVDTFILFSIKTVLFIMVLFLASIVLDKVRIWVWNNVFKHIKLINII